jgi:hypothetical protein
MTDLVCHCFGYSASDTKEDAMANKGRPVILGRIVAEKKAGNCQCATLHPRGR